jgi:phosphopantothenoylcysteine synthetase/decarboxylase
MNSQRHATTHDRIQLERFRTCADLQQLLGTHADQADILIMAAAVADHRPKPNPAMSRGKFRRTGGSISLELESTPDLLAGPTTSSSVSRWSRERTCEPPPSRS